MEKIRIITTAGSVDFTGIHRPDLEKPNWHYYQREDGKIMHFRKEHMIAVVEMPDLAVYLRQAIYERDNPVTPANHRERFYGEE